MKNEKGSMAIEASMIISFFVLAYASLSYLSSFITAQMIIKDAISSVCKELSIYSYDSDEEIDNVSEQVKEYIDFDLDKLGVVDGKDGLNFDNSNVSDKDINIVVSYKMQPKILPFGAKSDFLAFSYKQSAITKKWSKE